MADKSRLVRVEDNDPRRCQSIGGRIGQCPFQAIEGSNHCPLHAGHGNIVEEKKKLRNFRLTQWQTRLEEFSDNPQVKSLREEIGILRIMNENIINLCQTPNDILLYSGKIADLVSRTEKVITSCHRIEEKTGFLLDKSAAIHLASRMVDIISQHVKDEEIVNKIAGSIIEEILKSNKDTTNVD